MTHCLRAPFLLITIILFSYGCASTQLIIPGEELSIDQRAKIIWKNNEKTSTHHIIVQGDSIFAWEYTTSSEMVAHISDVQSIVFNDYGKGATQGLIGGVLVGLGFSVLIETAFGGGEHATQGMLVGGPVGATLGLLFGSIIGTKTRYIIEPSASEFSLADRTILEVDYGPAPGSIDSSEVIPENPNQEPISQIDFSRARAAIYLGPSGQVGLHFFGRNAGGIYESIGGLSMNWYRDRLFSTISHLSNDLPGNPYRYYVNMAMLTTTGSGDIEGVRVDRTNVQINISLGTEGYRAGNAHIGKLGFFELGLIYGDERESYRDERSSLHLDGVGVMTAGGMRWYRRSLLGEAKITINSRSRNLIPSLLVGYRY